MKQLITAILGSVLFCACGNQPQNSSVVLELSDTEIINIVPGTPHLIRTDNAKIIGMDEMLNMVNSIDYIKLDSSDPIGTINKMIVTKDKIFILDSHVAQRIFVFDKTGKLLYRIKNKGRGPKEYVSIRDMQIDTVRNEILVNDALACSYLHFSADNGRFIRKEKSIANCYVTRIDSLYVNFTATKQDFNDKENWSILVTDKDSVLYKGFKPTPLQDDDYISNNFSYDHDGNLLYTPVYSDTVYQFTSASMVSPKYVVCQKKSVWTLYDQRISPLEVNKLIKQNNYTKYCGKFLAGRNYTSFEIDHKWEGYVTPRPYFWDKRTDLVYAWDTANVDEHAVVHEIIRQPIAVYGDTFFGTISPQIPEEYRKNLNPKIKSLLECSEESDNPIVVLYTLK